VNTLFSVEERRGEQKIFTSKGKTSPQQGANFTLGVIFYRVLILSGNKFVRLIISVL
jgi:hypothetical protein